MVLGVIYDLLVEVVGGYLDRKLPSLRPKILKQRAELRKKLPFLNSVSAHKKELFSQVRRMPFIYNKMKLTVLDDYVMANLVSVNLNTLVKTPISDPIYSLQNQNKVLFLGDAGIGKTTFQRHAILTIIKNKPVYFHPNKKLIPFYVPLKMVNNEQQFPILNYLLDKYTYLSGKSGFKKLHKLSEAQRLFIILDGYDEIQFPGGIKGNNYIKDELTLMMRPRDYEPHEVTFGSKMYKSFYNNLRYNYVWMTCRDAFYEQHYLQADGAIGRNPLRLYSIRNEGIIDKRIDLIKSVFSKYPRKQKYKDLLDADYFLDQIDEHEDQEIRDISYKPLFLTILCYTYATKAIKAKSYKVKAAESFRDLIPECVSLLLIDLDEAKTRGFSEPKRALLRKTRNDFIPEKTDYLPFFATQLFRDDKRAFDYDYIKTKVFEFFELHPNPRYQDKERIINGLQTDDTRYPNFVRQLINCGIFTIQEKTAETVLYDFPHFSFREVLASKYFEIQGSDFIFTYLKEKELSELLYVYFTITKAYDLVLNNLLNLSVSNFQDAEYYNSVLLTCLRKAPDDYDPNPTLNAFFIKCIERNSRLVFPSEIKDYIRRDEGLIEFIREQFKVAVDLNQSYSLQLCCDLLYYHDRSLLNEMLTNQFWSSVNLGHTAELIFYCQLLNKYNKQLFDKLLEGFFFSSIEGQDTTRFSECLKIILSFNKRLIEELFNKLLTTKRREELYRLCETLQDVVGNDSMLRGLLSSAFKDAFKYKHPAELSFVIDLISNHEKTLLKEISQNEFVTRTDGEQQKSLTVLCESLVHSDRDLLKELLASIFQRVIITSETESIVFYSRLIPRYENNLYNNLLTTHLITSIKKNVRLNMPEEVLDNFHPDEDFINNLLISYERNFGASRMLSFSLCCELLFKYHPKELLQRLITDLLNKRGEDIETPLKFIITHREVFNYIKRAKGLPLLIRKIITTSDYLDQASAGELVNLGKPLHGTKYYFVVDEHVINCSKSWIEKKNLQVGIDFISNIESIKNKVFMSAEAIWEDYTQVNPRLQKIIVRLSRTDSSILNMLLNMLKDFKQGGYFQYMCFTQANIP